MKVTLNLGLVEPRGSGHSSSAAFLVLAPDNVNTEDFFISRPASDGGCRLFRRPVRARHHHDHWDGAPPAQEGGCLHEAASSQVQTAEPAVLSGRRSWDPVGSRPWSGEPEVSWNGVGKQKEAIKIAWSQLQLVDRALILQKHYIAGGREVERKHNYTRNY